jgi:monoamine oxidase
MREAERVIVIGAGAAGLAAARVLGDARIHTVVLEARARVGGRVFTVEDPAFPAAIELGAEFVHGPAEATMRLLREARAVAYDVAPLHLQRTERGLEEADFERSIGQVMGRLDRLGQDDVDFDTFLREHAADVDEEARVMARSFVEGFDAADPARISAKSVKEEGEGIGDLGGQSQYRILGGYGQLIEHVRERLSREHVEVRLGAVVRAVRWSKGRVQVEVESGGHCETITARAAIVTVPIGVLKAGAGMPGAVRFEPELSGLRDALAGLESGPVIRVALKFREAFWESGEIARAAGAEGERLRDASFLHFPRAVFPTWWTTLPLRTPVLTAWAGGPKAASLSGGGEDVIARALETLAELLQIPRRRIESLFECGRTHDWPADPYARGAYSYVGVGGMGARAALARVGEGTLCFAGEAADDSGQASTVAGALASGEAAAERVRRAM